MNWVKQTLANVAGTQEPIYGPGAIQSVATQTRTTPYTELKKDDLRWKAMGSTCVETQTFYLNSDDGDLAILQVIYSNVAGIHTTCQFNSKVFSRDPDFPHIWHTDPVQDYMFDEDMFSFAGDNIALTLNEDGTSYSVKAAIHEDTLVNITATRLTPGFCVGDDGTSLFGTDPEKPWGSMRHAFWPRCQVEGTIVTKEREIDFKGRGLFIHALQGMKPHHAASKWNFVNFQTQTYSAIMMEFTTPPSYGSTVVTVGGIAKNEEIVCAGTSLSATHVESANDSEINWPEPKAIKYIWDGRTKDGKDVSAVVEGPLGERLDRVDVMAEVPSIIKAIAGSVAGTRPYIYQFSPQPKLSIKLRIGDAEIVEEGTLFTEATFIS